MAYYIGDLVRVSAVFKNTSDVETDPTTITMKFKDPASVITTYVHSTDSELVKDSTGNYHVDLTLDQDGHWYYQFIGTGTVVAGEEARFEVEVSQFD